MGAGTFAGADGSRSPSALELELEQAQSGGPAPLRSWFEGRTFTYALGVEHPLYARLKEAGEGK